MDYKLCFFRTFAQNINRMKYILTLISTLLLLTACHKDDGADYTEQKATRAVMIYMAGENNLTKSAGGVRYLQKDLDEIIEGSKLLTDKQRLFVFIDSLGTDSKYKGTPYIIEVHGGKAIERYSYSSDFYSCDPAKFREVISWMTSSISADGFGLVLWGHATGWAVDPDTVVSSRRAYGMDSGSDDGSKKEKWMNITQMAEAMSSLPKMDFIFADCCNMMCAEVGYELRNATEYLIGSPAEIPGNGAPYDKMVPMFYKNGSALYRGIIDTYYDYYSDYYVTSHSYLSGYSVPLSVIETQYMPQLAQRTHDILSQFTNGYPQYPSSPDMQGTAYYFGLDAPMMYDMRAFIKRNTTDDVFRQWSQSYQQAVPYYRMSMKWMTIFDGYPYYDMESDFSTFIQDESLYGCVSMFIPMDNSDYNNGFYKYNATCRNFGWNRLMDWNRFGWN